MLAKRIIACLDVKDGKVIKGVKFRDHQVVGDIVTMAERYSEMGVDELVFYDIAASCEKRVVSTQWIADIAGSISIPFSVAGGIRTVEDARRILHAGADKISINNPALERPELIQELSREFGRQCITVGIDSQYRDGSYYVYQYTGDSKKTRNSLRKTKDWLLEVQQLGAGEIVLNCMQSDGVKNGYDVNQLMAMQTYCQVPLIASGGAGNIEHFIELFHNTSVSGALAASVFHHNLISIKSLKKSLRQAAIEVRYD